VPEEKKKTMTLACTNEDEIAHLELSNAKLCETNLILREEGDWEIVRENEGTVPSFFPRSSRSIPEIVN